RARVERGLPRVDRCLEAVFEVPDGDAARARQRLPGSGKGGGERGEEARVVTFREVVRLQVRAPGPLRRREPVRVQTERVEDLHRAAARAIRSPEIPDEVRGRDAGHAIRARIVV